MINEGLKFKGHWTIEIREQGKVVRTIDIDNQLTNLYKQSVLNQLNGASFDDLEIKYLAVGTGDTPASASDTQLEDEQFRQIPTTKQLFADYEQTIWVIPTNLGNFTYKEIGVFAGNATSTADSGMLLSRINVNIEKTSSMEVTFIRRDYVTI